MIDKIEARVSNESDRDGHKRDLWQRPALQRLQGHQAETGKHAGMVEGAKLDMS